MIIKSIAFKDATECIEDLPYPIVLYPGFYGAFFGFKQAPKSDIYVCACSRVAIENYVSFRLSREIPKNSNKERMYILDSMYFPISFVQLLMSKGIPSSIEVLQAIKYKENLCHECNKIVPAYRYCHEMYGGAFKQTYGWFINKQGFELGIEPISNMILGDVCPEEITDLIGMDPVVFHEEYRLLREQNLPAAFELEKVYQKQMRKVWRAVENEVRNKFDVKKVGEAWTNETILYHLVLNIFPRKKVLRHYRSDYLERLELDIFIPELNLGLEYQGIQHYKPVKHWGGNEALLKTQERDKRKKILCQVNNINLIYFYHTEQLSNELVTKKLHGYV